MANTNRPSGLSPVRYLNGAPWTGGGRTYAIPTSDSTNTYAIGDPVDMAGSATTAGVPTITVHNPGAALCVGVIAAVGTAPYGSGYYNALNLNTVTAPAAKASVYYALVIDDPNVIFQVQEIGTGTALTATEVGLNCNLVTGANNGYISGWLLTNTTEATTSSLDVKLLGLSQIFNNAFGAYAKWDVVFNAHYFKAGATAV